MTERSGDDVAHIVDNVLEKVSIICDRKDLGPKSVKYATQVAINTLMDTVILVSDLQPIPTQPVETSQPEEPKRFIIDDRAAGSLELRYRQDKSSALSKFRSKARRASLLGRRQLYSDTTSIRGGRQENQTALEELPKRKKLVFNLGDDDLVMHPEELRRRKALETILRKEKEIKDRIRFGIRRTKIRALTTLTLAASSNKKEPPKKGSEYFDTSYLTESTETEIIRHDGTECVVDHNDEIVSQRQINKMFGMGQQTINPKYLSSQTLVDDDAMEITSKAAPRPKKGKKAKRRVSTAPTFFLATTNQRDPGTDWIADYKSSIATGVVVRRGSMIRAGPKREGGSSPVKPTTAPMTQDVRIEISAPLELPDPVLNKPRSAMSFNPVAKSIRNPSRKLGTPNMRIRTPSYRYRASRRLARADSEMEFAKSLSSSSLFSSSFYSECMSPQKVIHAPRTLSDVKETRYQREFKRAPKGRIRRAEFDNTSSWTSLDIF